MTHELTATEQDELQELILDSGGPGASSFHVVGGYEIHPRGEPGDDLAQPVQDWLTGRGFVRYVDRSRGPFYRRDGRQPTDEGGNG